MLCRNHDAVEPWSGGDHAALEQLAEQVYPGLRRIAHGCKKNERAGNTLQATAPVYEVYLRLVDVTKIERQERARFFAMAAQMMRRIRVTAGARRWCAITRRRLAKGEHRGDRRSVRPRRTGQFLAVDETLTAFSQFAPRQAKVVELRYFGGLTEEQIA